MKFYNRKSELALLQRIIEGKSTRIVVIRGIRRIGKTRLVLESIKGKESIRIFIPKDKTVSSFLNDASKEHNLPLFNRLVDFVKYLFDKYKIIFFDEFQNFEYLDKSIFSEMQDIIDKCKMEGKDLCLFISGSSYSLLKKIFYDYAKSLYGRKDIEINLFEFDIKTILEIFSDLGIGNMEDRIKMWAIFGGIPKYYELLESLKIKDFKDFINLFYIQNFRSLLEEVTSILVSELGGEYKSYYTVMEAIAFSKNKLSEIASLFDNDINAANRYLDLLIKEYNLVRKILPVIEKTRGMTRYKNKSNLFDFWFRFIRKNRDFYEIKQFDNIIKNFDEDFIKYMGRKFEEFIISLFEEKIIKIFEIDKIGGQWGKFKGEKGKNTYEIDIVALNEEKKEILFGECKWKNKVNVLEIVNELKEKGNYVDWHNDKRKEHYAVFAKSFSKRIKEFEGKKVYCFDLKDIERLLKKKG